jgi:hypothetical protein
MVTKKVHQGLGLTGTGKAWRGIVFDFQHYLHGIKKAYECKISTGRYVWPPGGYDDAQRDQI